MYQNFTAERIYGYELAPYKLRAFPPMQFFSHELIRQLLNVAEIVFVSRNKKNQFKLKTQFGQFIVNIEAGEKR